MEEKILVKNYTTFLKENNNMKIKYKLKKTYPTCIVKLGTIVLKGESHDPNPDKYGTEDNECFFTVAEVENHPEFWQRVLEEENLCVPIGTKFKTKKDGDIYVIHKIEDNLVRVRLESGSIKGTYYKIVFVNQYFQDGIWKIYTEPETKEDIMQKCIKMFPKGSLVKSPEDGEVYRIRTEVYFTEYNGMIEGVYYYGGIDIQILAVREDSPIGFYLYYNGRYGELIKEEPKKEYEILEFKAKDEKLGWEGESAKLNKETGEYYINENTSWTLNSLLNEGVSVANGELYISKVRRLSDGEEFCINDKVKISKLKHMDGSFIIDKFYFDCNNDKLLCNGKNSGNGHVSITKIEKVKNEKLFTTFDGVDIFEGDKYYTVFFKKEGGLPENVNLFEINGVFIAKPLHKFLIWADNCKYYSTEEKALEYIKLNKKCLSLQDILDSESDNVRFKDSEIFNRLKNTVK